MHFLFQQFTNPCGAIVAATQEPGAIPKSGQAAHRPTVATQGREQARGGSHTRVAPRSSRDF
jgi:hypothetical protein